MILLEARKTSDGTIEVMKSRTDGSVFYLQGVGIQSHADENGEALLGYGQMMCCVALAAAAKTALIIGCAGGTITTTLHRRGVRTTTLDVNHHAFDLAVRYFNMPTGLETHVADGRDFLAFDRRRWDSVIIDAYDGIKMSARLMTVDFYRLVKERLSTQGLVIVNIVLDSPSDRTADRIGSAMNDAGLPTRLFDDSGKDGGNCIIVGGAAELVESRLGAREEKLRVALETFRLRPLIRCEPFRDWVLHRA
jgi:spermidine synthase